MTAAVEHRYQAISERLERSIASGELRVGDAVPSEASLCRDFGVSRFTVRAALARLESLGLIRRSRGAPAVVIATRPRAVYHFSSADTEPGLLRYAEHTELRITRQWRAVRARDREEHDLEPGDWQRLDGIRLADDGQPVGIVAAFVRSQFVSCVDPPRPGAIYSQIVERAGLQLSHLSQEIYATSVSRTEARALRTPAGAAALALVRRYHAHDVGVFEVSRVVHPGDRFRYSFTIELPGGATGNSVPEL